MLQALFVFFFLVITTGCQLSPQLAEPSGEVYGDKAKLFVHHTRFDLSRYEIYLDQQKMSAERLDIEGVQLPFGSHAIDVIDKKTSKKLKHIDFKFDKDKHFNLCPAKTGSDVILEEQGEGSICIPNSLK